MNIGEHLLRKYGGRDPEDDPGPPPPGSWVVALCIVVIGVPAAIWLVTLAWNEQAAAKALVALVVPGLIVSIFLRDRWGRRVVAFPFPRRPNRLLWMLDMDRPDRGSATLSSYALGLVLFILSIGLISVAVHWGWASVRTRRRRYWYWFY
jgi:hypothetical protein